MRAGAWRQVYFLRREGLKQAGAFIISGPLRTGALPRILQEQVGAIGPGMVWNLKEWFLYVNGYHEVGAENRAGGNKVVLRVEKVFGKETK
jgi:hypothetical protein